MRITGVAAEVVRLSLEAEVYLAEAEEAEALAVAASEEVWEAAEVLVPGSK